MRARFWSDDFDMDLLKLLPDLEEILGDAADVVLCTYGGTSHGRLNHPSCWNTSSGLAAFFGFRDAAKPESFSAGDRELVRCTFEEAIRDCWPHTYVMLVERRPIFDSQKLRRDFDLLMSHRRKWHEAQTDHDRALVRLREQLELASVRLLALAVHHPHEHEAAVRDA